MAAVGSFATALSFPFGIDLVVEEVAGAFLDRTVLLGGKEDSP